ncbi:Syntaxin-binding protein 3 [Chytriomyces hyalinus]|nr:Syntaxin-binding protein 3 [Chytriomyces hyalinus]
MSDQKINTAAAQVSLKLIMRGSILSEIKKYLEKTPHLAAGTVLVTDEDGDRVLSDCACTVDEMMSVGVMAKESLFAKRNPRPSTAVIYFVSPKIAVASRIVDDFRTNLYSSIFIFLTEDSDEFYDVLQPASSNIAACVAFAFSFTSLESRVFTINKPESTYHLWMADGEEGLNLAISEYADKFRDVLTSMNTEPVIRYYDPYGNGKTIAARTAIALKERMDAYKVENDTFPAPSPYDHLGPATVVVLDRSFDLTAPLLHSLSFQAAAHDMVKLTEQVDMATNLKHLIWSDPDNSDTEKNAIMDESSPLFNSLRHLFIAFAMEEVNETLRSFAKVDQTKANSVEEIQRKFYDTIDLASQKPQLVAVSELLQTIMADVKERHLIPLTMLEQRIAVGKTEEGGSLARKKAIDQVRKLLGDYDIQKQDKLRIFLVLTLAFGGTSQKDFTLLWRDALLNETDAILLRGLEFFGLNVQQAKELSEARETSTWNVASIFKNRGSAAEAHQEDDLKLYDLYEPKIAKVLKDQINGRLDNRAEFKLAKGKVDERQRSIKGHVGTIRRGQLGDALTVGGDKVGKGILLDFKSEFVPTWGRARPKAEGDLGGDYRANGARTILIMVGGLSYAEVRAVYLTGMKAEREAYVGSTHMITPNDFVESLTQLGEMNEPPYDFLQKNMPAEIPFLIPDDIDSPPTIARPLAAGPATMSEINLPSTSKSGETLKPLPAAPSVSAPDLSAADHSAAMYNSSTNLTAPSFSTGSYRGPPAISSHTEAPLQNYQPPPTLQEQAAERDRARQGISRPSSVISYEGFGASTSASGAGNRGESSLRNTVSTNSTPPATAATIDNYSSTAPAYGQPASRPYSSSFQGRTSSMGAYEAYGNQAPVHPPPPPQTPPPQLAARPSSIVLDNYQSGYAAAGSGMANMNISAPAPPRSPVPGPSEVAGTSRAKATVHELLAYSSQNMQAQQKIDAVMAVAPPEYSREVIEADLLYTGIVEVTIDRIFSGVLPPQGMKYPKKQSTVLGQHTQQEQGEVVRNDSISSNNSYASGISNTYNPANPANPYSGVGGGYNPSAQTSSQHHQSYYQPQQQQQQQQPAATQGYYTQSQQYAPANYYSAHQGQQQPASQGYYAAPAGYNQPYQQQPYQQQRPQFVPIQQQYVPGSNTPQYVAANTYQNPANTYNQQYMTPPSMNDGRNSSNSSQRTNGYGGSYLQQQQQQQLQNSRPHTPLQQQQQQQQYSRSQMQLEESQQVYGSSAGSGSSARLSSYEQPQVQTQRPPQQQQQQQAGPSAPAAVAGSAVSDPFPGWTGGWPLALTKQHQTYQREKQAYLRSLER